MTSFLSWHIGLSLLAEIQLALALVLGILYWIQERKLTARCCIFQLQLESRTQSQDYEKGGGTFPKGSHLRRRSAYSHRQ